VIVRVWLVEVLIAALVILNYQFLLVATSTGAYRIFALWRSSLELNQFSEVLLTSVMVKTSHPNLHPNGCDIDLRYDIGYTLNWQ
jgi:hypothetical protein